MQLHQIKPQYARKNRKRVGRGGKRGTFSGRGCKGQKSRAGHRKQPIVRELIKRYPKLRGYRFGPLDEHALAEVNLKALQGKFKEGDVVSPESLFGQGIIRKIKGRLPKVKILGQGELKKKLVIKNCYLSKQAKEKIEKAGGTIENVKIKNQSPSERERARAKRT